jgi:hypothetical protein
MTHDQLFNSAWLKWGRAVAHAQALEDEIDIFSEHGSRDPLLRFRVQYEPKRHGFAVVVEQVESLPPIWGLNLGDVAHNFKSSLDHLAWALVRRGRTPPDTLTWEQRRDIYFPVYDKRTTFDKKLPRKLPGVRLADIAKVRRRQPYHYTTRRPMHLLVILTNINNGDKHRTIQPMWAQPTTVNIAVTDARHCEVPRLGFKRNKNPLKVDTEIAYIGVRKKGPNPEIDVQLTVTAEPSIGSRVAFKEWVTRTAIYVSRMLIELSEPPPELEHVGCDLGRLQTAAAALRWP